MSSRQLASAKAGSVAEQASVSAAWRRASALRIACQTVRARWRLRQRRASRVLLPSARLRARKSCAGSCMQLGHGDAMQGGVQLTVAAAVQTVAVALTA